MDSITNKVTSAVGNKEESVGQPGNSIERSADNATNSKVDDVAGQAGVPQQADGAINKAVDGKINSEIPGGN